MRFSLFAQTLMFPRRFWPFSSSSSSSSSSSASHLHWIGYDAGTGFATRGRFSYWLDANRFYPRRRQSSQRMHTNPSADLLAGSSSAVLTNSDTHPILVGVASGGFAIEMEEMSDSQIVSIAINTLAKVCLHVACVVLLTRAISRVIDCINRCSTPPTFRHRCTI